MANSTFETLELRFKIEPELLQVYVLCGPASDGMLGVQGWHHKTFPKSVSIDDVLKNHIAKSEQLLWGLEAPE